MNTNSLAVAAGLSDDDLLARLDELARTEREALVELLVHLAELDTRPILYAARSYGSLFGYCTKVLHFSEDAACNRIEAARACRRFPLILDMLASGAMSLTSVRLVGRLLTAENHQTVLARASGRSRREIEALVAELAPRPDVATSVRKLATPTPKPLTASTPSSAGTHTESATIPSLEPPLSITAPPVAFVTSRRPIIDNTSPDRYRVQFTVGKESHDKLRRLQSLLRREIPDGDPGAIFDRALSLLLEKVERTKLGAAAKPRRPRPIRPRTDEQDWSRVKASRHIPSHVKRAVWHRDGGQCGFLAHDGQRCTERTFLEFHHLQPHALAGPATVENISLRCRRHNQYEAEVVFGPRGTSVVREAHGSPHSARGLVAGQVLE
jgi:hypothetical protein